MRSPYPVVLASASPRRRELLGKLVSSFEVEVSQVDEEALTVADPWVTAETLAGAKALAVSRSRAANCSADAIIIGADTVVALPEPEGYTQLAKPLDSEDAVRMLLKLSGKRHAVITGFSVMTPASSATRSDTAWVTFRDITESEIREYVATGEPLDKAGAYAIQGGAAGFVAKLEGEISTVIGLPMPALEDVLKNIGEGRSA